MSERFTVRWYAVRSGVLRSLRPGFAVFDQGRRITITFPHLADAEAHRARIAEIYARFGW